MRAVCLPGLHAARVSLSVSVHTSVECDAGCVSRLVYNVCCMALPEAEGVAPHAPLIHIADQDV